MSTAVHYSFLNHRLISHPALPYSFFLISRFRYSPLICLPTYSAVFPSNYVSLWFVPLSLYSDRELLFNGPLVYTTLSCFVLLLSIRFLNFTCPLARTSFLLFSLGIFSQPIGPYLSGLILFRLFFYLSIGLYPFVLVSFRLRFTFSLDRTAFSFFFSLFMFPLYHLLFNCQYIFQKYFKFFYSFCFTIFIFEFSENSDRFSVFSGMPALSGNHPEPACILCSRPYTKSLLLPS